MIFDRLSNADRYAALHPGLAQAFAFLRNADPAALPEGRNEIDGDRLFALVVRAEGKGRSGARLEAHRDYLDIQYCVRGGECIGWEDAALCAEESEGYDLEKDLEFFRGEPAAWIDVPSGTFGIFFPEDAHAPLGGTGPLHKIVVKVAVAW
ncbi:MAG: YhcH/YjgK/YiaL family protein [Planctomycetota bacterium]